MASIASQSLEVKRASGSQGAWKSSMYQDLYTQHDRCQDIVENIEYSKPCASTAPIWLYPGQLLLASMQSWLFLFTSFIEACCQQEQGYERAVTGARQLTFALISMMLDVVHAFVIHDHSRCQETMNSV